MTQAFLCVIEKDDHGFSGYALDVSANVSQKDTREDVIESLREAIALSLYWHHVYGDPIPEPTSKETEVELQDGDELIYLVPKESNPVSAELARVMHLKHVNQSQLAKSVGVSRQAINRIVDPFYFRQSLRSLHTVAEALGATLDVRLELSER